MTRAAKPRGVVLLHGHGRSGRSMAWLNRQLQAEGYATWAPTYRSLIHPMPTIIRQLRPGIAAFAAEVDGPIHFVTHSLGGLVALALLKTWQPVWPGYVVMLGPPLGGSEWADLLARLRLDRIALGPVGPGLRTGQAHDWPAITFPLGIIAGDRPLDPILPRLVIRGPNDGKVSVAATRIDGMGDHITLPVSHTFMLRNQLVLRQILSFLEFQRFQHRPM